MSDDHPDPQVRRRAAGLRQHVNDFAAVVVSHPTAEQRAIIEQAAAAAHTLYTNHKGDFEDLLRKIQDLLQKLARDLGGDGAMSQGAEEFLARLSECLRNAPLMY